MYSIFFTSFFRIDFKIIHRVNFPFNTGLNIEMYIKSDFKIYRPIFQYDLLNAKTWCHFE